MACSSYLVYTGVTDAGLCTGGGTPITVYIDSPTIPFPLGTVVYSDPCPSIIPFGDSFYFYYSNYFYNYSGSDSEITLAEPCPCPTNCDDCGPSYSAYSEDQCYSLVTTSATPPSTILSLVPVSYVTYSVSGTFVYDPGYSVSGYTNFSGGDFTILPYVPLWTNTVPEDTVKGPLNRCAVWTTSSSFGEPYNVWVGFSQCIDINETKTYYVGIGADNDFKLVIDGTTIVNTRLANSYWYMIGNRPFNRWNVYPITLNSGNHIVELYGWNDGSFGSVGCEIYNNTFSELQSATLYSELDIVFTSSGASEVTLVQNSSDEYLSSGYTCSPGYIYNACDNTCVLYEFCDICPPEFYCIYNTGIYDGNYTADGTYNSHTYYTGDTGYIFYSSGETRWCLSLNLGGPCVQFGPYNSSSTSPDLDDTVMYSGVCVTTTTTTNPCVDFDFSAIFDCLVTPTPSLSPTNTPTPTLTPTPTSSAICGGASMTVTFSGYTPTPTPTNTPTPSPSPDVTRPCSFSGDVTFSTISEILQCANSKRFTNCFTGIHYYTSDLVLVNGDTSPKENYVYNAVVNGQGMCVLFDGLFENISGVDSITLTNEVGSQIDGACLQCIPNLSQTPTPTPTNTPTPTPSVSPCVLYQYRITNLSPSIIKYDYTTCSGSEKGTVQSNSAIIICSTTTPKSSSSNAVIDFLTTVCV